MLLFKFSGNSQSDKTGVTAELDSQSHMTVFGIEYYLLNAY